MIEFFKRLWWAIRPTPYWACFHCGEVFTDPDEAETHFGTWSSDVPACKETDIAPVLIHRARQAEADAGRAHIEARQAEDKTEQVESLLADWKAVTGCSDPHDARHRLDGMQGLLDVNKMYWELLKQIAIRCGYQDIVWGKLYTGAKDDTLLMEKAENGRTAHAVDMVDYIGAHMQLLDVALESIRDGGTVSKQPLRARWGGGLGDATANKRIQEAEEAGRRWREYITSPEGLAKMKALVQHAYTKIDGDKNAD